MTVRESHEGDISLVLFDVKGLFPLGAQAGAWAGKFRHFGQLLQVTGSIVGFKWLPLSLLGTETQRVDVS